MATEVCIPRNISLRRAIIKLDSGTEIFWLLKYLGTGRPGLPLTDNLSQSMSYVI